MLEVSIDSLRVSLTNQQRILLLKEPQSNRFLPIWIGAFEAESIVIALQQIEVSRPQTHDLLKLSIQAMEGRIRQVEIDSMRADTFYAFLVLECSDKEKRVDCRPSDAIALAVRCHVPILVNADVFEQAGIVKEEDMTGSLIPAEPDDQPEKDDEFQEVDLSIYDDFLKSIDADNDNGSADKDRPDSDDKTTPGELI